MSTTSDLITAAVLFGPGIALSIPILISQRGAKADSEAIQTVLAFSAAERAAALQNEDGPTPPHGGEPAPVPAPATVERLATVINFPTSTAA